MGVALISLLHGRERVRPEMVNLFDEPADQKIVVWSAVDSDEVKQEDTRALWDAGVDLIFEASSLTYGQAILLAARRVADEDIVVYASGRRAVVHQRGWLTDMVQPFSDPWCGMTGCVRPCQYDRIARIQTDIFEPQIHVQGGCFAIRASMLRDCGFGKFPQVFSDVFLSHAVIKRGHYLKNIPSIRCDEGEAVFQAAKLSVGYPDRSNRRQAFQQAVQTPGDINEHLHTLRSYAGRASRILEFGTRGAVSTLAFLCGQPDRLTTVDIDPDLVPMSRIQFLRENAGCTDFRQEINDSRTRRPEWADLVFIDTDHNYPTLTAELDRHHAMTTRWLIMHDTETYPGCMDAVKDFLKRERSFRLLHHFPHNNGLTILERCQ